MVSRTCTGSGHMRQKPPLSNSRSEALDFVPVADHIPQSGHAILRSSHEPRHMELIMKINIKQSFLIAALVSFVSVSPAQAGPTDVEMVKLSGGSFLMGSESGDASERPVHRVSVKPFAIGKYEVLGFQYRAFETATGRGGAKYYGDKAPVVNVSWHDAQAYIAWLNGRTGLSYRLPTEAEWEYAARAGSRTKYHFGDDEHSLYRYANYGERNSGPIKAGSFRPNAWGLYDMLGNAWEWVLDCWHEDYSGAPSDGRAWESGCTRAGWAIARDWAVGRGGSWYDDAGTLRSANRNWTHWTNRSVVIGFRLVQDL